MSHICDFKTGSNFANHIKQYFTNVCGKAESVRRKRIEDDGR
jgi:hypothetical protein